MDSRFTLLLLVGLGVFASGSILSRDEALLQEGKAVLGKLKAEFNEDSDDAESNASLQNKHQKFFQGLSSEEQQWILRLAISHEAVRQSNSLKSERPIGSFGINPTPVGDLSLIPESVMKMMLNGDISEKFQEKLIKWLRKDLGFTNQDFAKFTVNNFQSCKDGECMTLKGIGGMCCPFG